MKSAAFSGSLFMKLTSAEQHRGQTSLHTNQTLSLESRDKNSCMLLSKIWLSLC